MNQRLLLDAHIIRFLLYEPEKVPQDLKRVLAAKTNELMVSEATLWELVNKAGALRLPLAGSDPEVIREDIQSIGVTWLRITQTAILASASLPLIHGDPFDRILIAEAQARNLTLVTKDRLIHQYAVRTLWASVPSQKKSPAGTGLPQAKQLKLYGRAANVPFTTPFTFGVTTGAARPTHW